MDITPERLVEIGNRFDRLHQAEVAVLNHYANALISTEEIRRLESLVKNSCGAEVSIKPGPMDEMLQTWEDLDRTIPTPKNEFEQRCLELARLPVAVSATPECLDDLKRGLREATVEEELFLTRPFPERLAWCLSLAKSIRELVRLYWDTQSGFRKRLGLKPLDPKQVTEALVASKTKELGVGHNTLELIRSGEWRIASVLRFMYSVLCTKQEDTLQGEQCRFLLGQCVEGHCIVAGVREKLLEKENSTSEDGEVAYLIGYLGYWCTPFREFSEAVAQLPSSPAVVRLKVEQSSEQPLTWRAVREAALSFASEVESLHTAAMNQQAEAVIQSLLALKRHAHTLARLFVASCGE